ncbi:hypothetical protein [Paraferrimonas haliotis]|uniref:Uncharacterized protein n=1 Tax=Paraferrimonas haliotis TaxID=2013866 RepID=A0AA37TRQ9_9GAMM|nr:hypothetical protein [Paraferrimonas haliotis]GLS84503.1 hypothetical protein GCM10007894_24800 [Paraferrimonas haliotis]
MLKNIFILALAFSLTIGEAAYASPLSNLLQQCQSLTLSPVEYKSELSPLANAIAVERADLGLRNLSDGLNYAQKKFSQFFNQDQASQVLACQMQLTDYRQQRLMQLNQAPWQSALQHSQDPQLQQLALRWQWLARQQLPKTTQLSLIASQTEFQHRLNLPSQSISLERAQCMVDDRTHIGLAEVSRYLLNQADAHCRQRIWHAYQSRGGYAAQTALHRYQTELEQLAEKNFYPDVASYLLRDNLLNTPKQVADYLDISASYHAQTLPPWDLGWTLRQMGAPAIDVDPKALALSIFTQLGLRTDKIDENYWRLWQGKRLLGQINWQASPKQIDHLTVRQSVLGSQFGVSELIAPERLLNARQQQRFVESLALAIRNLAAGSRFYLNNRYVVERDGQRLAGHWLKAQFASQQGLPPQIVNAQKQWQNYRARVALAAYQKPEQRINPVSAFNQRFSKPLANSGTDMRFSGLVVQAANLYQGLWQQDMGHWLERLRQQNCLTQDQLFDVLFVNEAGFTAKRQLHQLFGHQSPFELTKRMINEIYHTRAVTDHCQL